MGDYIWQLLVTVTLNVLSPTHPQLANGFSEKSCQEDESIALQPHLIQLTLLTTYTPFSYFSFTSRTVLCRKGYHHLNFSIMLLLSWFIRGLGVFQSSGGWGGEGCGGDEWVYHNCISDSLSGPIGVESLLITSRCCYYEFH